MILIRVLLIGACLSVAACADYRFVMFEPVQTDLIEKKLKIGSSTRDDVRAVLGEPVGSGRVMYPFDEKPYTMLGYCYETGSMSETKSTWLVIFFDKETYKGYAWFSDVLKAP